MNRLSRFYFYKIGDGQQQQRQDKRDKKMEYKIGTSVVQDWVITRKIGEGASGTVFEIEKSEYGIKASSALKVICIPKTQSELSSVRNEGMDEESVTGYFRAFVDEIVQEIAIMTTLKNHPNIVNYEDHHVLPHEGNIGWDILIRMELLTPLNNWLKSQGGISEKEVVSLGKQMCQALSYCETLNLIHRDIKPENIFIDSFGNFKLGDFGIARTVEKTGSGLSKKGTESYMAPEVYLGKSYGPTVDLYSLGLVLYKLTNRNRLPFLPPAPEPITYSHREDALSSRITGRQLPPPADASPALAEVILKACAYREEERFRDAHEMLQALEKAESGRKNRRNGTARSGYFRKRSRTGKCR